VLVFARLARRDLESAAHNVAALAALCWCVLLVAGGASGTWREPLYWLALLLIAGWIAGAAAVGVRWARRWTKWRGGTLTKAG
jgi:hypothetical protein